MRLEIATAAALLAATSFAFAIDANGGGGARGDGINKDGSSDDAKACREGTAGAALCREGQKRKKGDNQ